MRIVLVLLMMLPLTASAQVIPGQGPPGVMVQLWPPPLQEPILRIDPGMHTATIRRIAVDAACTLVATASLRQDRATVAAAGRKLLRTLRPPIGPGHWGKLVCGRNGARRQLGCCRWPLTLLESCMRSNYVYIFQGATGSILARLGPLRLRILDTSLRRPMGAPHCGYRPIADCMYGRERGLTWRIGGFREGRRFASQRSYGAVFDRSGVLYTVALDGKLRRYAPGYEVKPIWIALRGGKLPTSVAVHPSGDRVAVSYQDTPAVEVYDAATLAWRFSCRYRLSTMATSSQSPGLLTGRGSMRVANSTGAERSQFASGTGRQRSSRENSTVREVPLCTSSRVVTVPLAHTVQPSACLLPTASAGSGRRPCRPTYVASTGKADPSRGRTAAAFSSGLRRGEKPSPLRLGN